MLLVLLLFCSSVSAIVLQQPSACRGLARDDLLTCFSTLLDGDSDGNVTAVEIDTFLSTQQALGNTSCIPQGELFFNLTSGATIVSHCDLNADGMLSEAADWGNQTTSCLTRPVMRNYICNLCINCGWQPTIILRKSSFFT